MSRSQVSRWTRAENQPSYDSVHRLALALSSRPDGRNPAAALLEAAGYGATAPEVAPEELSGVELDDAAARDIEEIKTLLAGWRTSQPDLIPQAKRILKALDDAS